jgi:hypothetical protein
MYYVLDNACATLQDAEEVVMLYKVAGVVADIQTEAEYFQQLHWANQPPYNSSSHETAYWNDPV